jgi:hypothetical protein
MSHTDKIAAARSVLEQFNSSAPKEKQVDIERFFKQLEESGGVTEEILREATWEDIENCGLPRLLAKRIASIFRQATPVGEAQTTPTPVTSYVSEKKAARMTPKELIEAYDSNEVDSPVANELHKRSEGKRFLFVNDDNTVSVEASLAEFFAIRRGHPEREVAKANGKTYTLRRVKDRPAELAEENPIYRGRALRPDGSCDQTNRSWANVPDVVRQLVYLAIHDTGEAKVSNLDAANDMIDRAIAPNAETLLRDRYVRSAARFDELKKLGELPKLKVVFGGSQAPKSNDPFFGASRHVRY